MKNGLPVSALSEFVNEVRAAPGEAKASYGVHARWETGTRLAASAEPMHLGGRCVARSFSWKIDEPRQLLGANHGPNPQELLLSGVAGCIGVAFVMGATARGVQIESLEIVLEGDLDLRGFMGLGGTPATGFPAIRYTLRVAADAPRETLDEIRREALAHSPNAQTIMSAVPFVGDLEVLTEPASEHIADAPAMRAARAAATAG